MSWLAYTQSAADIKDMSRTLPALHTESSNKHRIADVRLAPVLANGGLLAMLRPAAPNQLPSFGCAEWAPAQCPLRALPFEQPIQATDYKRSLVTGSFRIWVERLLREVWDDAVPYGAWPNYHRWVEAELELRPRSLLWRRLWKTWRSWRICCQWAQVLEPAALTRGQNLAATSDLPVLVSTRVVQAGFESDHHQKAVLKQAA